MYVKVHIIILYHLQVNHQKKYNIYIIYNIYIVCTEITTSQTSHRSNVYRTLWRKQGVLKKKKKNASGDAANAAAPKDCT